MVLCMLYFEKDNYSMYKPSGSSRRMPLATGTVFVSSRKSFSFLPINLQETNKKKFWGIYRLEIAPQVANTFQC